MKRTRVICLMSTRAVSTAHAKICPLVWLQGIVNNLILELLRKSK